MADTQKLKVFISWAGDRANMIGAGFHNYLPDVVNAIEPFMSSKNIDKGTRWSDVLSGSLQKSSCAIVCLTRESMQSVWVGFEAGAISRAAGNVEEARARIWTYLSGVEAPDLQLSPFAGYQATGSTEQETFGLIDSINRLSPDPVPPESLKRRFDRVFWPNFEDVLKRAADHQRTEEVEPAKKAPADNPEMLVEILNTLRSVQRDVSLLTSATLSIKPQSPIELDVQAALPIVLRDIFAEFGIVDDYLLEMLPEGTARILFNGRLVELSPSDVRDAVLRPNRLRSLISLRVEAALQLAEDSPKVDGAGLQNLARGARK